MESHKTMNTESASRDQLAAANSSSACLSRWEAKGNPSCSTTCIPNIPIPSHGTTNSKYARVGEQQKLHQVTSTLKPELNQLENDSTTWLDYDYKLRKPITSQASGFISSMAGKNPHLLRWFRWKTSSYEEFTIYFTPAMFELFHHTLWWTYKKLLKMTIEIVDFPMKNGDFP